MSKVGWLTKFKRGRGTASALDWGIADNHDYARPVKKKIWTVGGGKGGVGKSFIASNLGALLAGSGKKVLLVDTDLGAANLHTLVRADKSRMSLSNFLLTGNLSDVPHLLCNTSVPNLELISGAKDSLDVADFNGDRIGRLREALNSVGHDHVILDIGPGTSKTNLDLFLMADEGILVTTPDPTSIENSYRFLKCLYRHMIKNIIRSQDNSKLKELIYKVVYNNGNPPLMTTIADILLSVERLDHEQGQILKALVSDVKVSIIINQARSSVEKDLGLSIKRACYDFFGLEVGYLGCISYDDSVVDSIRQRKPLTVHFKQSEAARGVVACLEQLQEL